MTYYTQFLLSQDADMIQRVTSCASLEGVEDPMGWAYSKNWRLAAQPGWDEAYASAIAANVPDPGRDEAVISDAMILSAVQLLMSEDDDEGQGSTDENDEDESIEP